MEIRATLTDAGYRDAYAEALLCLADDTRAVGTPFRGAINGTVARYCIVDDAMLSDREVLELWWKRDITPEILQGR